MKTMTVGDFKTHFSEVLKSVEAGEKIGITYGKAKTIKAYLVPKEEKTQPRKLGILKGTARVTFKKDFTMSTEEFLGARTI